MARIRFIAGTVTAGSEAMNIRFSVAAAGALVAACFINSTALAPVTNGAFGLGATSNRLSDIWLDQNKKLDWNSGNVTLTHSAGLLTLAGGGWKLAAGTNALGPLQFQSGTNLTTATAGNWEFDGTCFYATAVASARQIVTCEQVSIPTADFAGADVNTAQPWFTAAQDTFTVAGSTTYEFEGVFWSTRAAGVNSHTFSMLFGGTATFTGIMYIAHISNPTGTVLGADQILVANVATGTVLTAANTSATENIFLHIRGSMRINAGGTVIPQFQYSAAPGGAPTIKKDTFFRIWPIGSNSVAQVGNIA